MKLAHLASSRSRTPMAVAFMLAMFVSASPAQALPASGNDRLRVAYTPRVFHFTSNKDYVDWNHIVAVEFVTPRHARWGADRSHFGLSLFDNSFGQFSQSIYAGLEWDWKPAWGGQLFFALSPGLVHGYKAPYENRVPLNKALGVGVTVVPALGWEREHLGFAVSLVGSALGVRASWSFGR